MELMAEQILEELGLKQDNYMLNEWKRFISLIESYNNGNISRLEDNLYGVESDLDDVTEERDEALNDVQDLRCAIGGAISDLHNIDTSQEESEIASDIQRIIKTLQSNL